MCIHICDVYVRQPDATRACMVGNLQKLLLMRTNNSGDEPSTEHCSTPTPHINEPAAKVCCTDRKRPAAVHTLSSRQHATSPLLGSTGYATNVTVMLSPLQDSQHASTRVTPHPRCPSIKPLLCPRSHVAPTCSRGIGLITSPSNPHIASCHTGRVMWQAASTPPCCAVHGVDRHHSAEHGRNTATGAVSRAAPQTDKLHRKPRAQRCRRCQWRRHARQQSVGPIKSQHITAAPVGTAGKPTAAQAQSACLFAALIGATTDKQTIAVAPRSPDPHARKARPTFLPLPVAQGTADRRSRMRSALPTRVTVTHFQSRTQGMTTQGNPLQHRR